MKKFGVIDYIGVFHNQFTAESIELNKLSKIKLSKISAVRTTTMSFSGTTYIL